MRQTSRIPCLAFIGALLAALLAACGSSGESEPALMDVGRDVYGSICSACHGEAGQGGTGPALDSVAETFPSCDDQKRWVTLGSVRWRAEVGDTYGAADKPVVGGMPENGERLTDEEIAAVVVFERVRYGGQDLADVVTDCGVEAASSALEGAEPEPSLPRGTRPSLLTDRLETSRTKSSRSQGSTPPHLDHFRSS